MIQLNYTINNYFSGWFDDDSSFPGGVFSHCKAYRFFSAEDCFSNQEPFIEDNSESYCAGPIKFEEDWEEQEMKSYEFVNL